MTVNGSWWRPTVSMPKIRSDGARSTGAAMASVRMSAMADMAATSATRPVIRHQGNDKKERRSERPGADVAHMRRQTGVADHEVQRSEYRDLGEAQQREAGHKRLPVDGDERRYRQCDVQTNLELGKQGDGALWILERCARGEHRREDARVRRTEQVNEQAAQSPAEERSAPRSCTSAVTPAGRKEHDNPGEEQLVKRVNEEGGRANQRRRESDNQQSRDAETDKEGCSREECQSAPAPAVRIREDRCKVRGNERCGYALLCHDESAPGGGQHI